jgi:hypothetical protein
MRVAAAPAGAGLSKLDSMRAPRRSARDTRGWAVRRCSPGPVDIPGTGGARPPVAPEVLPRKEVIQPHLPVRLPCYDFTPVTGPTFDGSLPCGLGHRLRALPIPVV